jgi:hypothetical protein
LPEPAPPGRLGIVAALGTTQTLAWASSYYLAAILADPIAHDLGMSRATVFAPFSAALVVAALLGPRVGRTIDRLGGREVLAVSNALFAGARRARRGRWGIYASACRLIFSVCLRRAP